MKMQIELSVIVGLCFAAGFSLAAGHKAADWLIPDPPREPLVLKVTPDNDADTTAPTAKPEERSTP